MKKAVRVILILVVAIIVIGVVGLFFLTRGLKSGSKVEISSINPSSLDDGIYKGSYSAGRWSNELAVTMKGGKIQEIKIIKDMDIAPPEISNEIFSRVIKLQNTDVDAVSGATVTSKAYLKSIETALTK
ncbi:FMN-binding protein [Lacrimispora sp.]|uniref:FMN-binding protein n=1 Tax=Lacrimispora sp. TaxID=2719234 RepID=UPI0028AAC27E|nr:FMN-binding protein [Lacrimispora sp.]